MGNRTVALIAGGWSREREVSLQSGAFVYDNLDKDKYEVRRYDPKFDLDMLIRDSKEIDIARKEKTAVFRDCLTSWMFRTWAQAFWQAHWQ
jgi:D-alanine-D-alanine ligase-like ATP-grasp enzyme